MIFPLISLKNRFANRGIPGICSQVNNQDCSVLSCFFPNVFVMQAADPWQRNHVVIIRFFRLNRTTWYKLQITKYKLQTAMYVYIS